MNKKFLIASWVNIAVMLIVTIVIYASLSQPYYCYPDGTYSNVFDYLKEQETLWIACPGVSLLFLVLSVRIKPLSVVAGGLSFAFYYMVFVGAFVHEFLSAFKEPWIGPSSTTLGQGVNLMGRFSSLSVKICVIQMLIYIAHYVYSRLKNKGSAVDNKQTQD